MNTEVHPAIAAGILVMTVMSVALWAWASGTASSYGGPAELRMAPNGHAYVQIQNYLVEHDESGGWVQTHDLSELGVELFLGSFAFFANGDLLLRLGPDSRSFMDNFRAYKRETNQNSVVPEGPDSGLFRCSLTSMDCERFGEAGTDFKAAFGVYIDWHTDDVYFSDTTRHLLRKFSADGIEQAVSEESFKFPNQLMLRDGQLLVADTNHHVVHVVQPGVLDFGTSIERKSVVPAAARNAQQTWPSHFARVGDTWWVNNMMTGMNNGGVYVFDSDWTYQRRLELPGGADPIAILPVGDEVWVSDWNNDVVHRLSSEGSPLPNLNSAGLESILEESRGQRFFYTVLSFTGVVLVAFMFLGLVLRAVLQGAGKPPGGKVAEGLTQEAFDESVRLHLEPDEKVRKRLTNAVWTVGLLLLLGVVPLLLILNKSAEPASVVPLLWPGAALFAITLLTFWVNRSNWGTSITIENGYVTLRDFTGRESRCSVQKVRYDDTAIATPDALVILGRPQAQIYKRDDVQVKLLPRLAEARRVGPLEMMKIQIQLRHPQGMVTVLVLVGLLVFGALQIVQ